MFYLRSSCFVFFVNRPKIVKIAFKKKKFILTIRPASEVNENEMCINFFNAILLCSKVFSLFMTINLQTILSQGSKLILFLSRLLATIWSKKAAKCKMWVVKIGKKEKSFFPW